MQIDLEHLKGWIGREGRSDEMLTSALVARFNATFDRSSATDEGAEAPVFIHLCLGQPTVPTAELGSDGHPARGGFLPPVPLPRRMWAGGMVEFHGPIRIGDCVTRRSVIEDVTSKQGRSGALCFVTVRHHVESGGRPALTERQDIVYREAQPSLPPPAVGASHAPASAHQRQVAAGAPFLFRYSALTFNGHRIHYDAPYARDEEHYPGPVIHGPLQATMLCQYASDLRGTAPRIFRFRSVAPIFSPGPFTLNAAPDGDMLKLWTAQPGGPLSMEATAQW
ncbi:FAS1-like dehydratase domain-containing protein [Frigidibacter mobilis]|uniref:FAS1-like dehydratase domain-containing protein n=1 Tax=Frigidibacter mobilis TaxID=1335048 RepID=A0A159Z3S0_9RHOB|nr:MaoC family dehydratase N-terminal domain-containing protein [Frigidibacter mobilis]AMY68860.1 hypothetical protein AKL17_1608 [Frigidibacter mobilis]